MLTLFPIKIIINNNNSSINFTYVFSCWVGIIKFLQVGHMTEKKKG